MEEMTTRQERLEKITEPLLKWFEGNARILPWREDPAPYRVWVSEIMLQQTRVEAVKPFFERFTRALPGVKELAEVEEEKLLKLWEGLGYYNRVRNMQKAARQVMEEYEGVLPADYDKLLSLPGIGSYTAGAIASIAYGIPVPAVDGNVLRVISRVLASTDDILKQSVKKAMEAELIKVMPVDRAGAYNQALMELGATVCVPNRQAKCGECPLHSICEASRLGIEMELPKKTPKKARKIEDMTVLLLKESDRIGINKRPSKGLLAGLYEFPNVPGHLSQDQVLEYVKRMGMSPLHIKQLDEAKHIFSHREWHMIGYMVRIEDTEEEAGEKLLFVEPERTEREYPIPAAFAAYTRYMNIRLGQEKYEDEDR